MNVNAVTLLEVCSLHLWNPVFNARHVESGTQLPSTKTRDDGRVMWKTARCAASRISCGLSMTTRRRNFLSLRNWNEKTDLRLRTSDFGPQTSDLRLRWLHRRRPVVGRRSDACCPRSRYSLSLPSRAIVTGITGGTDRNGNRLQCWQDGGAQYGDHAV
jgi:hypothetical protein